MPFSSEAQRKFMWARHPEMAKHWEEVTPKDKKLPDHVKKKVAAATQARLKLHNRKFHGFDDAFRNASKGREVSVGEAAAKSAIKGK